MQYIYYIVYKALSIGIFAVFWTAATDPIVQCRLTPSTILLNHILTYLPPPRLPFPVYMRISTISPPMPLRLLWLITFVHFCSSPSICLQRIHAKAEYNIEIAKIRIDKIWNVEFMAQIYLLLRTGSYQMRCAEKVSVLDLLARTNNTNAFLPFLPTGVHRSANEWTIGVIGQFSVPSFPYQ